MSDGDDTRDRHLEDLLGGAIPTRQEELITTLRAEIERLTRERDEAFRQAREFQTDAKRVGDRIDEQYAEIERLKAEIRRYEEICYQPQRE